MRILTDNELDKLNGTFYVGMIHSTYKKLVKLFGEPKKSSDGKVQAEWDFELLPGIVFTIYNWEEDNPELATEWCVGTHRQEDFPAIEQILKALLGAPVLPYHLILLLNHSLTSVMASEYIKLLAEDTNASIVQVIDSGVKRLAYQIKGAGEARFLDMILLIDKDDYDKLEQILEKNERIVLRYLNLSIANISTK